MENSTIASADGTSASANTSTSLLYATYKDAGVRPELVLMTGVRTLIGILGLFLNSGLILVTVRSNWLHGHCNLLLALYACAQIGFELSFLVAFLPTLFGVNFLSLSSCFSLMALPTVFFASSWVLMLAIALDRLFIVFSPIQYNLTSPALRLAAALFCCAIFAAYMLYIGVKNSMNLGQIQVICTVNAVQQKDSTSNMNLCFPALSALIYLAIGIRMRTSGTSLEAARRIIKSLTVILVLELFGWATAATINSVVKATKVDDLHSFFIQYVGYWLAALSSAISAFVLYSFSTDYRRAFDQQFPALKLLRLRAPSDITTLRPNGSNIVPLALPQRLPNITSPKFVNIVEPMKVVGNNGQMPKILGQARQ